MRAIPFVRQRRGQAGFTALETLAVLALMGIMMLISIPALMDFFRAIRVRAAQERLVSHMRLCRQIAVTRRSSVRMMIEGKALDSTYAAWEDLDGNATRDNGEEWVVRQDRQLEQDRINMTDAYNDTTTASGHDETITSALESNKLLLSFRPNGQVIRINQATGDPILNDTLLRVRLRGRVNNGRCDEWEVSFNRPGKVGGDWKKIEENIPADCTND